MKKYILTALLGLLVFSIPAQCRTFGILTRGPFHRRNQKFMLKVAPYNAFTPFCAGRVNCIGGCGPQHYGPTMPSMGVGMPMMHPGYCDAGEEMGVEAEAVDETMSVSVPAPAQATATDRVIPTGQLQRPLTTPQPRTWPMPMPQYPTAGYGGYGYGYGYYPINYYANPYYWNMLRNAYGR